MSRTRGTPFDAVVGNPLPTLRTRNDTYLHWYLDLKNLYISNFEWSGLDYPIDLGRVESYLLERGSVAFFIDEIVGPLVLPFVNSGYYDAYGNPSFIRVYGVNGYQKDLLPGQFVIIWDNTGKAIHDVDLRMYASRLALLDSVQDTNIKAQRTPYLISTETEGQLATLKAAYRKIEDGDPVIAQIGAAISQGLGVYTTQAPIVFGELQTQKLNLISEALTFIGVPNRGDPKKERMINQEVSAINGHVVHERTDRYLPRLKACDQINRMFGKFGVNVSVDFANKDYNIGIQDTQIATPEVR